MTLFVAAVEHAARTFLTALAERYSGPASYEDSDYLAADRLADLEAEQEVAEPAAKTSAASPAAVDDPTGNPPAPLGSTPSPTTPSASQPPVDDARWPADCDIPPSPAGQPLTPAASAGRAESDSPEVSAPTAPSGEQGTPGSFAAVAVREVLAGVVRCGRGEICIEDSRTDSWSADDWYDWREYVAAEVRRRIDAAKRAAPQFIETGHDMGASIASELFPQHRKSIK